MWAVVMMDKVLLYKALAKNGAEKSASGNPVVLTDTIEGKSLKELKLYGWSKQESTTGANLIDVDSMLNECLVKNDDGTYSILKTETNRFSKQFPVNLTAGTVIRFDADVIKYNGAYHLNLQISFNYQTISVGQTIILNSDVTKVSIYQDSKNDVGTYTKFKNAILSIGRTQIPYEPYTGGKPSPNPDSPQQIVSAGNSGNIEVNVRGKNLVDVYGYSANDIPNPEAERVLFNTYGTTLSTTEKTDKLIVHQEIIDGATANNYTSGYFCIGINRKLETGKDYIITFNINVIQNPFSVSTVFVLFNGIEANKAEVIGDKVIVKVSCKEYRERQYVEVRNCGMSLKISNFMITEENESTIYEPYYEPQTISISTPTGLPAIPVDTDGNYTDANGQRWIADYVDLKRGKYVQMVNSLTLDGDKLKFVENSLGNFWNLPQKTIVKPSGYFILSKYFSKRSFSVNGVYDFIFTTKNQMAGLFETVDELNAFVAKKYKENNPVVLYYFMREPIERDLTPEEIQAYKNLVTYAGTTIVENDAECYMEVSAGGGDALRAKKLALILGD